VTVSLLYTKTFHCRTMPGQVMRQWMRTGLAAQNEDAYWSFVDSVHASQREINGKGTQELRLAELDRIAMQQGADHKVDAASLQACVKTQNDAAIKAACMKENQSAWIPRLRCSLTVKKCPAAWPRFPRLRAALDRALKNSGTVVPTAPQTRLRTKPTFSRDKKRPQRMPRPDASEQFESNKWFNRLWP